MPPRSLDEKWNLSLKIDHVQPEEYMWQQKVIYIYMYKIFCCRSKERIEYFIGWNDEIVALEKTTWFPFRLMKTGFLFLLQTIY